MRAPPEPEQIRAWSALRIASEVRRGGVAAERVLDVFLARIDAIDAGIGAFLRICETRAREAARRVDAAVGSGFDPGPLAGVPVAVKDNLALRGAPTTCGSRYLERFAPLYDAEAVARIERDGGIPIGKTNLDEFGFGSSTEHSAFGPTRNPWNQERVPGGSSGGSAAAVAAGMAPLAIGSDTGGSVRQPAAFCGVVGLKPGYGRISRRGLVAFASSLDCVGAIARDARDAALLADTLAGWDPGDATSLGDRRPIDLDAESVRPGGLRVGIGEGWMRTGVDPDLLAACARAAARLQDRGARIEPVDLPPTEEIAAVYRIIAAAEASSNLSRYDGARYGRRASGIHDLDLLYERSRSEGFGREVKRRILLGAFVLSAGYRESYYATAMRARANLRRRLLATLGPLDAILVPTAPTAAFRLGERLDDPLAMYDSDRFTLLASLAGVPAVSCPGGLSREGMPIGVQLVGGPGGEGRLLGIARILEDSDDGERSVRDGRGPAAAGTGGAEEP